MVKSISSSISSEMLRNAALLSISIRNAAFPAFRTAENSCCSIFT
jgi:hypothetical protein